MLKMGRFDGFLICSDLDGTLLADDKHVPERNIRALDMFMREGGRFTVCTGRARQTFSRLLETVTVNAPVVLANGALVYDFEKNKTLLTNHIPDSAAELCREAFKKFSMSAVEAHTEESIYICKHNEYTKHHETLLRFEGLYVSSIDEIPFPWLKVLFVGPTEELKDIERWIKREYPGMYDAYMSCPRLLELQNVTANKGEGVKWLAEYLNISHDRVFVAGDFDNDLPMLTRFRSFVPENAPEHIKQSADRVVCGCNEGALADAVEYIAGVVG